jgi:hypothetical protein
MPWLMPDFAIARALQRGGYPAIQVSEGLDVRLAGTMPRY